MLKSHHTHKHIQLLGTDLIFFFFLKKMTPKPPKSEERYECTREKLNRFHARQTPNKPGLVPQTCGYTATWEAGPSYPAQQGYLKAKSSKQNKQNFKRPEYSSVLEHLPNRYEILGSIPSIIERR